MRVLKLRWRAACAAAFSFLLVVYLIKRFFLSQSASNCIENYQEVPYLKDSLSYCNPIYNNPVTGSEGEVNPEEWKLKSVHILIRHGDRLNIHSIPNLEKQVNASCQMEDKFTDVVPEMKDFEATMRDNYKRLHNDGKSPVENLGLYPNTKRCMLAKLTPEGAAQHVKIGAFLKKQYLDRWHLLKQDDFYQQLYLRSTTISRTYQSAMAFLYGFLPYFDASNLNIDLVQNNTLCSVHTKFPCSCESMERYIDQFSCNFAQTSPQVLGQRNVQNFYTNLAKELGVNRSDLSKMSHVFDIIMVHACHNRSMKVSESDHCLNPSVIKEVVKLLHENGAKQIHNPLYQRAAKLKFQPLFFEIVNRMIAQTSDETPVKFTLYSGHDSSVEPFAIALGFSNGLWPKYATRIVLELYTSAKPEEKGKAAIRILYNGEVVTGLTSFCRDKLIDINIGLCPLEYFRQFADYGNIRDLGEKNYQEACIPK